MSRASPTDVGLPVGCRVDERGSVVGFEGPGVKLPWSGHLCPGCRRRKIGHGSYVKTMAHSVGRVPRKLEVEVPRSRCKKCGVTVRAKVSFTSVANPGVTEALEARIAKLLRQRVMVKEAAVLRAVPHNAVRLVIDGARVRRPKLPRILLMDEV